MAFLACLGFLVPSRLFIDFSNLVLVMPRYVSVIKAMLVQGISNAAHTLELIPAGDGPVPVAAFRVYRPPLR